MVGFAWGLNAIVCVLAVLAWGQTAFEFGAVTSYTLFPVFGLLAFSMMWTHYVVGAVRRMAGVDKQPLKQYFAVTGWAAIVFILLHPSLLILRLWRDGQGLPPGSYYAYVGPSLKWAVTLATLSLLIFLSFETKRWFDKKGWWPVIEYANVVAMFAIIAHSLALGSNLQKGWFRYVWLGYGLSLLASVGFIYYQEAKRAKKEGNLMKKIIGIAVTVAIIAGVAGFAYTKISKDEVGRPNSTTPASQESAATGEPTEQDTFTVEQVKEHGSADDCWTIISGSVYDITDFIPRHPGGDEILRACGEDATTLFRQRRDENGDAIGSGTPHSSSAASQLEQFKIGLLQ